MFEVDEKKGITRNLTALVSPTALAAQTASRRVGK